MFSLRLFPVPPCRSITSTLPPPPPPPQLHKPTFPSTPCSSHSLSKISNKTNYTKVLVSLPKFRKQLVVAVNASNIVSGQEIAENAVVDEELRLDLMPKHVAVILDGNRRWGQQRGLPVDLTHKAGAQRVKEMATLCRNWGIKVLSVFAFSTENWSRPKEEVDILMNLFQEEMISYLQDAMRFGDRISVIGDMSKLPSLLQRVISEVEKATKPNSTFHLVVAINYGGQQDITQACRKVAKKVKDGLIRVEDINENMFQQELLTNCTEYPNPDLLLRSSGELRVSNFLLWQLAYTELCFVKTLWPDFGETDFAEALRSIIPTTAETLYIDRGQA